MDRTVPAGAALLLEFIYETETKKKVPFCYDVIYGNRQSALDNRLTQMTLKEVQVQQKTWSTKAWAKRFRSTKASSAAGAAQFMHRTLKELIDELGLSVSQKFDANLQDRLAYHLLKRRGYGKFVSGQISRTAFGKALAQEWASFPVLAPTKGGSRQVERGQSYYAGDGLNKALVEPETVEKLLDEVKTAADYIRPIPEEIPIVEDLPDTQPVKSTGVIPALMFAITTTLIAIWTWFTELPCTLTNLFCGG